ncbi:MAG: hypothetical protein QW424_02790 [Candidatus Bathyarchaeia archaeon]
MERFIQISCGEGKWKVDLILIKTTPGKGMIAVLIGGEEPHVGAVAVAIPSSIIHHPEKMRSSISIFTVPGHMDDQVAAPLAKKLSEELGEPVVMICGLHIHEATSYDIEKLIENSNFVVNEAVKRIIG